MRWVPFFLVVAAWAVGAPLSQAHHSYSMFDSTRPAQVRGTVKAVEWVSPHVWLWVTVEPAGAQPVTYGFETASPGQLLRDFGWLRNSVNVGDKVIVDFAPLRSGRAGGGLNQLTLPDGKVLLTRFARTGGDSGQDAGPPKN